MISKSEKGVSGLKRFRVKQIGFSFEAQEYGLAMLDGCPDYCWKTIKVFYDEEEANAFIGRLEADFQKTVRQAGKQ